LLDLWHIVKVNEKLHIFARHGTQQRLKTILQILPRPPGRQEGVGDYALQLAKVLREQYDCESVFVPAAPSPVGNVDGFEILPSLASTFSIEQYDDVILHYVNYGYEQRGVPLSLPSFLRRLRRSYRGRLLTIFHELYASGPPWKSAFWLQPLQKKIAREIARLSDATVVSNERTYEQLQELASGVRATVLPVISNFGEPSLSPAQLADRDPHRWAICGGTALVARSLQTFRAIQNRIPDSFSARELFVLGGTDNPAVRATLSALSGPQTDYRPEINRAEASQILSTCSFAWLDYFHRRDVPTTAILKSTAFAAVCAHGIIAVFPHPGSVISLREDRLPGPYFVAADRAELPPDRAAVAAEVYAWYQRNASSQCLARGIAQALWA
jgi:hypothetical protein